MTVGGSTKSVSQAERVLVLWADGGSRNLGVRALAQGTQALTQSALGDQIEVVGRDFGPAGDGLSLGGRAVARDVVLHDGRIAGLLDSFDLIVDTGAGDSFTDIYGPRRLAVMLHVRSQARQLGKPYIFGPQTLGPFEHAATRIFARRSLGDATAVIARDSTSARYAETVLRRRPDATATDVVFALPVPPRTRTRDVVLNVSGLLWGGSAHVDQARYRSTVRTLCAEILAQGRALTLLAHVLDSPYADNDVPAVRELGAELGERVEVVVPAGLGDAREVLASANVVVASRMHASLNGLSVGTPAVSLAYSRKFAPLMSDLGWEMTIDLRTNPDPSRAALAALDSIARGVDVDGVRSTARTRLELAADVIASAVR